MDFINTSFRAGLDVGSTTAKLSIIDSEGNLVFSAYERHNTKIYETVNRFLKQASTVTGNAKIGIAVTGSAGIGISETMKLPFVQEVIAATEIIKNKYSEVKTLIDIGGEDSKMIFFSNDKPPDIRMNGNCAGGTGAFIDQMAILLNIQSSELNILAKDAKLVYLIASRCGVFAKTDVQNLLSRKIDKCDIAASIFNAVAVQTMNTLARGFEISKKVMFIGGPFTFLPQLRKAFENLIGLSSSDVIIPAYPELFPATGAAYINIDDRVYYTVNQLIEKISNINQKSHNCNTRLEPLFSSKYEFAKWNSERKIISIPEKSINELAHNDDLFLGIDSGSTTTKIAVVTSKGELVFKFYANNSGNPVETVEKGLLELKKQAENYHKEIVIKYSAVTGYGEDLIKAAFGIDIGLVETIAHFSAAKFFVPDVSFIMDIGGQDMKAIFVENGIVKRIELNESCSSGCGSFIETFGTSLGYSRTNFADLACESTAPCDLGTRCTVFMNSKVKQALRENATPADIAAGLSVSVIKNAIFKVLKLKDYNELGECIVVQGGTFRNLSVFRALEQLTGKIILSANIPEMMGALGAAFHAIKLSGDKLKSSFFGLANLQQLDNYENKIITCKGCENNCAVTKFIFPNRNVFYAGNKCEKVFINRGNSTEQGLDLFGYKNEILFNRNLKPKSDKIILRIGMPRGLNQYENFPFWATLFTNCGIEVVLSAPSTMQLYETGIGTVMSDSICFPAKLLHGHIFNLVNQKVNRIFYPIVIFEKKEFENAVNSYNCPIVSSYSDVINSSVNTWKKYNIPIDSPPVTFDDESLLFKTCYNYLRKFGVKRYKIAIAFNLAIEEQRRFKNDISSKAIEIINKANKLKQPLIVLAGRPYHVDPLINHKTPQIISSLGANVIPEDCIPDCYQDHNVSHVISQWTYPNRLYNSAAWVGSQKSNVQFVQINSFGCGPDAITIDECTAILREYKKCHTLIRVDDITSTGSVKLRIRSLIESLEISKISDNQIFNKRNQTPPFTQKERTILAPYFGEIYSDFLPVLFELGGYKLINLPKPDKSSVEYGLKYSNNEICYPATIIVGDVIKALKSGNYNKDDIAIGITQTGGQCRASSYISIIRKAMIDAGFTDIPVVSVNSGNMDNQQPGFVVQWEKMLSITFIATLYADSLAKLYYPLIVREVNKGEAKALLTKYIQIGIEKIRNRDVKGIFNLLREAVKEFNNIDVHKKQYPKMGIVGEIYIKYNSYGHQYIIDWLNSQGIEVVVPPIVDFFIQVFVNIHVNKNNFLEKVKFKSQAFTFFIEQFANMYINKTNKILSRSKWVEPFTKIRDISKKAEKILSLANQFGEGWLIPAEICEFAEQGINHVISVQPFGCIANHIISKGVEKRMKDLYPELNLLYLDFDDGTSEVNVLNRLHFMVRNVKQYLST